MPELNGIPLVPQEKQQTDSNPLEHVVMWREALNKHLCEHMYARGCFDDFNYTESQRRAMEDMCFLIARFKG
mgnify:CR=1 FL=1